MGWYGVSAGRLRESDVEGFNGESEILLLSMAGFQHFQSPNTLTWPPPDTDLPRTVPHSPPPLTPDLLGTSGG